MSEERDENNTPVHVSQHIVTIGCGEEMYHILSEIRFFLDPDKPLIQKLRIKAPGFDKVLIYDCLKKGNPHKGIIDELFKCIQSDWYKIIPYQKNNILPSYFYKQ